MSVNPLDLFSGKPAIANRSIAIDQGLTVHYRHDLPGALDAPQGLSRHMLTFFLSTNERQVTHFDEWGEYDGKMEPGNFYLCPAGRSGFTRWQSVDKTLHLVIANTFLQKIARETDCANPNRIELLPVLKGNDRKLDSLVQLLLSELDQGDVGEQLYLESLGTLLGVHFLRHYCNIKTQLRQSTDGLPPHKLQTVLDYMQAHLNRELSLDTIAAQIGMSRCYFATQFKQAMGVAPYQYIKQQRIEKAKWFLRSQKLSITDIALECGFADQSHLTKVFKKLTGLTPKAYREQA